MNKQTLIILTPAFPANESEEETVWLPAKQSLISALNRTFPELEIIILSFQFPASRKPYTWHGNKVIPFSGENKVKGHNWMVWMRVFNTLRQLKKEKNIVGLLSCWCAECAFVAHYFAKLYGVKHLCWICGQDARAGNKFVKRIRPDALELVAMSDFLVAEFQRNHGIRPAHLVPDAIDTYLFDRVEKERNIDLLGAGGLHPLKQYDVFVSVVAAVRADLGNVNAYLCGDGTERPRIENEIKKADLEKELQLTGYLPQKQVLRLMQRTKVFLHTSNYEGFGNVCIEALYAGAHVISFTKPMNQDIPHWHIVTTKEEMIAKALDLLQDDTTDYTPVLPFDMEDSAKQFMQLFGAGSH